MKPIANVNKGNLQPKDAVQPQGKINRFVPGGLEGVDVLILDPEQWLLSPKRERLILTLSVITCIRRG